MSSSSAKVRYTPKGREGAKAVLTLTSGETLTETWPGADGTPEFIGVDRLTMNPALTAALHAFVVAKKAQRTAVNNVAQADVENGTTATTDMHADQADSVADTPTDDGAEPDAAADATDNSTSAEEEAERFARISRLWGKQQPDPLDVIQGRLRAQTDDAEKLLLKLAQIHGFGERESTQHDRNAWCSACLAKGVHRALDVPANWYDAWCCRNCGVITTRCAIPGCPNMAIRGMGVTGTRGLSLPVCAEHSHEVPDFETKDATIEDLEHWPDLFEYKRRNVTNLTKRGAVAAGITVLAVPAAYFAAPAIGGMVGAAASMGTGTALSGAAASSYGLALLGGGSIATGGLGMAGGTLVVSAAGGAAGSAYGLRVGSAYLGDDSSFDIECLRDGDGPAVVYSSGFLTDNDDSWANWKRLIDTGYPNNAVYRVRWGAKQKRDIATITGEGAGLRRGITKVGKAGLRATRSAVKRLGPFQMITGAAEMALNPWSVALRNSSAAGTTLAAILRRTENRQGFVLIGHSLGAAVMATAMIGLAADNEPSPVVTAHLLGAAFPATADCNKLSAGATGRIYNYFSTNDNVLAGLYRAARLGGKAAGSTGFINPCGGVVNVDVSDVVKKHSDYIHKVSLRMEA